MHAVNNTIQGGSPDTAQSSARLGSGYVAVGSNLVAVT